MDDEQEAVKENSDSVLIDRISALEEELRCEKEKSRKMSQSLLRLKGYLKDHLVKSRK